MKSLVAVYVNTKNLGREKSQSFVESVTNSLPKTDYIDYIDYIVIQTQDRETGIECVTTYPRS